MIRVLTIGELELSAATDFRESKSRVYKNSSTKEKKNSENRKNNYINWKKKK